MQSVAVDNANPEAGEEAYVLQLCLPDAPGADGGALMDKIGRFVGLYLSAAQPDAARYAQMGGLTWVIAAPAEAAFTLDQVRADLAQTLFGLDDGAQVQLEWPEGVEPVDPAAVEASDSHEAGEAPAPVEADDAQVEGESLDAWTVNDPAEPDHAVDFSGEDAVAIDGGADELDLDGFELNAAADVAPAEPDLALEPALEPEEDDVFIVDLPSTEPTDEFEDLADAPLTDGAPADEFSSHRSEAWEVATAAQRAAFDDTSDVFEVDALDIEIVDGPSLASEPAPEARIEALNVDLDAPLELEDLDDLTEAPERPQPNDVATELAAFRAEMRAIAASIPGAGGGEVLSDFRAELDAISGAMGQRVDGAAQRIEAAAQQVVDVADGLDAGRLSAAADRAEQSAAQLESGVTEALNALNAAVKAMSGAGEIAASDAIG